MTCAHPGPLRRRGWRPAAAAAAGLLALGAGCADGPEADGAGAPAEAAPGGAVATGAPCDVGDAGRRPLDGFGEVTFRVERPDRGEVVGCALLADSAEARSRGLMDQEDLRGYDAMVFRFEGPSTTGFYMYDTRLPLSIAYVDEAGGLVSSADMDPCLEEEASACPTYDAAGPYLHAIEVRQGDLPRVGIEAGATVRFEERSSS